MAELIRMLHRWVCIQCELTSPWTNDMRQVEKEAEAHTKGKGHHTMTHMVPEKAVRHERK